MPKALATILLIAMTSALAGAAVGANAGRQVGVNEERKVWSARLFGFQAEQVARMGKTDREHYATHPEARAD
jgi:hypothetical protein